MRYEVIVSLKKEVLDAEGRAICDSLKRLGYKGVESVKVSKRFEIEISGSEKESGSVVEKVCRDFLANEVAEDFAMRPL